jgi:hypothetical protein
VTVDYSRERHEAREEAERLLLDGDDQPAPHELAGEPRPKPMTADQILLARQDPWAQEAITPGVRVFHVSRFNEPDAVANGTGTVLGSRRLGSDVEYEVAYDKGGCGWHGSTDIRIARSEGDHEPPF